MSKAEYQKPFIISATLLYHYFSEIDIDSSSILDIFLSCAMSLQDVGDDGSPPLPFLL